MKFTVEEKVFEHMPEVCFALVAVQGINNKTEHEEINKLLQTNEENCRKSLQGYNVKEIPEVLCFREAFRELQMNPNKFMCSIEALLSRISKGNSMPLINAAVNLGNAISLKYKLPIGAHDIDTTNNELMVRFSQEEDRFIPFGSDKAEPIDKNEIVYVSEHSVRTRRWIWRQSEIGKIVQNTSNIFFPIDGFSNKNKESLLQAQEELALLLQKYFKCNVATGFVDKNNNTSIL